MIDAHAHLVDPRFAEDVDAVIARASAAGIERILSCGEDVASSERTLELARRHAGVRVAVGVHPHRAESWSDDVAAALRSLSSNGRVVAIGEIGVDLSGRSAPREAQERAFAAQLDLARERDLPVVVHVRDAGALAREIVDRVGGVRGMVHCYSEGPAEVDEWRRRGFAISFAGTVTYPKNAGLRAAAAATPLDALLVETDAPYLAPQRRRGGRNEPAFVLDTLAAVAAAHAVAPAVAGARVSANAARLFGARWLRGTA
ncbi:MAG TPA: TatD family hydrolase [Candidatus Limnocylindria bacterium]|nr:TatD family hydrolase [Candidatus Limnocylindria bacterium]